MLFGGAFLSNNHLCCSLYVYTRPLKRKSKPHTKIFSKLQRPFPWQLSFDLCLEEQGCRKKKYKFNRWINECVTKLVDKLGKTRFIHLFPYDYFNLTILLNRFPLFNVALWLVITTECPKVITLVFPSLSRLKTKISQL